MMDGERVCFARYEYNYCLLAAALAVRVYSYAQEGGHGISGRRISLALAESCHTAAATALLGSYY